jgi:hypothetical protein
MAPLKVQGTMEKDDEETEEKWSRRKGRKRKMIQQGKIYIYICKLFLFIKYHFLNLEAQYLIFNLLCTMLELGASFGKYNDFAYDILSTNNKLYKILSLPTY